MTVMSWGGLHPKLACRGRFDGFTKPPVIRCHLIRVTVERLPNGRKVPGPLWLWQAGPASPTSTCAPAATCTALTWSIPSFRFAKTSLGWARAALRSPGQFGRWTWIVICAITQLRLARPLAQDRRHPWERRRRPGKLTPGRVRRDFARLVLTAGTPASPPKPSKAGPGRPRGRTSTPAPRHDVIKKAA